VWQNYADSPAFRELAPSIATYRIESTHPPQAGGKGHLSLSQDRRSEVDPLRCALPASQLDSWNDHICVVRRCLTYWRKRGSAHDAAFSLAIRPTPVPPDLCERSTVVVSGKAAVNPYWAHPSVALICFAATVNCVASAVVRN
jgi:hypothetical protein